MLKKFWNFIDGNKTLICATILYAMTLSIVKDNVNADILSIAEYIMLAAGGAALVHKGKKAITPNSNVDKTEG